MEIKLMKKSKLANCNVVHNKLALIADDMVFCEFFYFSSDPRQK